MTLYFTELDGIQTAPAHVVNRTVLEDDAVVEGIDQHVIHLEDEGGYALVDDYELQGTWIEYVDVEREQRLLVPSERVEAIDMDTYMDINNSINIPHKITARHSRNNLCLIAILDVIVCPRLLFAIS